MLMILQNRVSLLVSALGPSMIRSVKIRNVSTRAFPRDPIGLVGEQDTGNVQQSVSMLSIETRKLPHRVNMGRLMEHNPSLIVGSVLSI